MPPPEEVIGSSCQEEISDGDKVLMPDGIERQCDNGTIKPLKCIQMYSFFPI